MLTANDIEHLIAVLDITRKQCLDGEFETLSESMKRHSLCSQLYVKLVYMKAAEEDWQQWYAKLGEQLGLTKPKK